VFVAMVLSGLFLGAGAASPQESDALGASMRGAGAVARGPVERARHYLAEGRLGDGRAALDEVLAKLRPRLEDPYDPLDRGSIVALAREAAGLRAEALLEEGGRPEVGEPGPNPASGSKRDFLRSIAGEATISDWAWGVPASITLAQAILESDWGRSAPGFNLFGMKGTGPAGSVQRRVVEYRHGRRSRPMASFRAYEDPAESVRDHGEMVGTRRAYARARAAGEDLATYARGLQGTYATDPRYAGKLLRLIDLYALDRFDWAASIPFGAPALPLPAPGDDPAPWEALGGWVAGL
jgi:hypothetical protein